MQKNYINNWNEFCHPKDVHYIYDISEKDILNQLINLKQLTFEVTDLCNLRCKYCGYGDFYNTHEKRENNFLSFSDAKALIDYLYNIWGHYSGTTFPRKIMFGFYGGEPLLNMNLIKQIIEYIDSLPKIENTYFIYNMTTNALLLDKYMNFIVEKKINLLISLDGDEYSHSYRVDSSGKNSFHKVINNINNLKSKYPKYFDNYVTFNSVLHNRNSVKGINDFIYNKFKIRPFISELNTFGICKDKLGEFNTMYHKVSSDVSYKDEKYFSYSSDMMGLFRFIEGMTKNTYYSYGSLLRKNVKYITPTGTCLPFEKKMFLTVKGKILACERIDQKYVLGSVKNKEVYLNLKEIAQKYSSYYKKIRPVCQKCYMKVFCFQCLYNIPNLDNNTISCPGFTNKMSFIQYVNYYCNILHNRPELYKQISKDLLLQK